MNGNSFHMDEGLPQVPAASVLSSPFATGIVGGGDSACPQSRSVVSISHLNYSFTNGSIKQQVLFDVNLNFHDGEITILTGPSGSGKTTLLTLIGGLRTCTDGDLTVLGHNLVGADNQQVVKVRRQIGFIFQAHNLMDFLTVEQNVSMSLALQENLTERQRQAMADHVLAQVGLKEHKKKYPSQLSGGQKQRVAVARALAPAPKLVLADEPTAALDKESGRTVVELIGHLAREQGATIILVTHDNRILDVADRILQMEDGRMIQV